MKLVDIHAHTLFGTDDGPKTEAEMRRLVDTMYAQGTRVLCVTPHFHPGYFGDNRKKADMAFETLSGYARERYGDLWLYRGNELRYSDDCVSWLSDGACRTLNGSRYLLVDFSAAEEQRRILKGLDNLMNAGYTPVLAHAERYEKLRGDLREIREMRQRGVIIQVDGDSLFGGFGLGAKVRSRKLLDQRLADLVASDAHDMSKRPPVMKKSCELIEKRWGEDYAKELCLVHPMRIINDIPVRKGSV